jgi:hypothetical protein
LTLAYTRRPPTLTSCRGEVNGPLSSLIRRIKIVGRRVRVATRLERSPPSRTRAAMACTNTGAEGPASDARLHVRGSAAGAADCHRTAQRRPWGFLALS